MEKLNSLISSISEACNPQKSTYSFAMDVIAIIRSDNTIASTPFYLKFGRFKLPRSSNTRVKLIVNDLETPVEMILSRSGKGYFVKQNNSSQTFDKTEDSKSFYSESDSEDQEDYQELEGNASFLYEEEVNKQSVNEDRAYRTGEELGGGHRAYLSNPELRSLELKYGENTVKYVTQGKKKKVVNGRIFLWYEEERIVVSDIDGTLTKSDVMGHFCYFIGKDWTRQGAATLYHSISQRNYKIVYLTARSINQTKSTSNLLQKMQQGSFNLPRGPIILNTCGMLKSLFGEISNTSINFKSSALISLLELFPLSINPFWSGFGNKTGDALAYLKVGIIQSRTFIFSKQKKIHSFETISTFDDVFSKLDEYFPIYHN